MRLKSSACVLAFLALATPVDAAEVMVPAYPWVPNDTFEVDPASLEAFAEPWCAAGGGDPVDFYLGEMPLAAFDALCGATPEEASVLLGDLYISGYFGGVWLRDALDASAPAAPFTRAALTGPALDAVLIRTLAAVAGAQLDRAQTGGDAEVVAAARAAVGTLYELYGYNLGYLKVILENPPPGVPAPEDALVCGDAFLDCRSPAYELEVLDAFAPALEALVSPSSVRWRRLAGLVESRGVAAVEEGVAVWEEILAEDDIAASAYLPLVDVSVGFLMVSEAAALGASAAWGDGDAAAARCTLALEAGLGVWSGSYFMGLASTAPAGTFPTVTCP